MNTLISAIKKIFTLLSQEKSSSTYTASYRVVEVLKTEDNEYTVCIQIIGKIHTFTMKPEEILADNKLVDQFSPRDIRTLTYLGYLGINAPKYKILARRLIEDNKMVFAIQKRGGKSVIVKTAKEILKEQDLISNMNSDDAKTVGYILGVENSTKIK